MPRSAAEFRPVRMSLVDLVGRAYVDAVVSANAYLTGRDAASLRDMARRKVDFFPAAMERRLASLLPRVGQSVAKPLAQTPAGASTERFNAATKVALAPLSGFGYYRIGEDGRLHFLSKSEHYHVPLGHAFPGYRLLEIARALGIPNATHNNTRGFITRRLEEELITRCQESGAGDQGEPFSSSAVQQFGTENAARKGGIQNRKSRIQDPLDRVLNLETGSLAAEAGLKLMLARFYRPQEDAPPPKYAGRTPVFIVLADDDGGLAANYHGTTVIAQMLRGMWPALSRRAKKGTFLISAKHPSGRLGREMRNVPFFAPLPPCVVVPVRPNDTSALESAFERYDHGTFKVAGFVCELVLMNYGARTLTVRFARRAQALCRRHDAPFMIDEIQTCLWSPDLFMFREYGLKPDIVAVGKGFPGGEYPASRLIFTAALDCLPQFGALVTNGQEEIASLAYLITMRWAEANAEVTAALGAEYEARLRDLAERFPHVLAGIDGRRHMCALSFHDLDVARAFTRHLVERGLDISVQTYKSICPPAALTKLPLIAGRKAVEFVLERIEKGLKAIAPPGLPGVCEAC